MVQTTTPISSGQISHPNEGHQGGILRSHQLRGATPILLLVGGRRGRLLGVALASWCGVLCEA